MWISFFGIPNYRWEIPSFGGLVFHYIFDKLRYNYISFRCCCSEAKSGPTLCDPMDCSTPGFLVLHWLQHLLKFMSIQSMIPSNHLILCHPFSSCLQSFPASGSFPLSWLFASGGQSIQASASASASVLPMNIQGWFPLGLTGLISLMSKGLSRVFSRTTTQKHQFFSTQPSLWSTSILQNDHHNKSMYIHHDTVFLLMTRALKINGLSNL